jgi:4-hydroxy-3-methylbut-2-enyl diphosphate reductase
MDTHAFKRSLHHSERYNRRGFGRAEEVAENLEQAYQSGLIGTIRDNGYKLTHGRLNVHLAEAFGFCWGVERAVAMAYETRRPLPQRAVVDHQRNHPQPLRQRSSARDGRFVYSG